MSFSSNKTKSRLWFSALLIMIVFSGSLWFNTVRPAKIIEDSQWNLQQNYQFNNIIAIQGIDNNLSGLTYQPESGHLYGIINKPEQIVVISKAGKLLRKIDLIGFSDTESIDYISGNRFIVIEERKHTINFLEITDSTTEIHYEDVETHAVSAPETSNKGIEGIAVSKQFGLFMVHENPAQILHFALEPHQRSKYFDALKTLRFDVGDFAGLTLLTGEEQTLLALSDESHSLHLLDLMGRERSRLRLGHGPFNLLPIMKQPEGVTTDTEGNIYIVGEPNQLLILTRLSTP